MAATDEVESSPEKPVIVDAAAPSSPDDNASPTDLAARRRIRYAEDEEDGEPSYVADIGHPLTRRASTYSVHSLASVRSGQRWVDPSIVLPVSYRTLSYDITHVKTIEKAKDAQEKAAVGETQHCPFSTNLPR